MSAEEERGSPAAIKLAEQIKKNETQKALLDKGLWEFNSHGMVDVLEDDKETKKSSSSR